MEKTTTARIRHCMTCARSQGRGRPTRRWLGTPSAMAPARRMATAPVSRADAACAVGDAGRRAVRRPSRGPSRWHARQRAGLRAGHAAAGIHDRDRTTSPDRHDRATRSPRGRPVAWRRRVPLAGAVDRPATTACTCSCSRICAERARHDRRAIPSPPPLYRCHTHACSRLSRPCSRSAARFRPRSSSRRTRPPTPWWPSARSTAP